MRGCVETGHAAVHERRADQHRARDEHAGGPEAHRGHAHEPHPQREGQVLGERGGGRAGAEEDHVGDAAEDRPRALAAVPARLCESGEKRPSHVVRICWNEAYMRAAIDRAIERASDR